VDVAREPDRAYALHAAIGNILRASGTESEQALHHLEAARNAAVLGKDSDALMASYLNLAEAYTEEGRALDSQKELVAASGVLADNFEEHRSKLNRGRGLAKFEVGFMDRALEYFEEAAQTAVQPEDKVRSALAIAMVHTCREQSSKSVQTLQQSQEVLTAVKKAVLKGLVGGLPADVYNGLTAEVHFRFAEAYHAVKNSDFAKAHYMKALTMQQKLTNPNAKRISTIRRGLKYLDNGIAPDLHCPSRPGIQHEKKPVQNMQDSTFHMKVKLLLEEHRYDAVEKELKASLSSQSRPYKSEGSAIALNMLGELYQKQRDFTKAAKQFRQALNAVIVCCGAEAQEAKKAYEGLRDVKAELPEYDARVAAAAIERYFDVLEKAGASVDALGKENENTRLHPWGQAIV
jgi:tetratricopeptide (TPR) repeat protein